MEQSTKLSDALREAVDKIRIARENITAIANPVDRAAAQAMLDLSLIATAAAKNKANGGG